MRSKRAGRLITGLTMVGLTVGLTACGDGEDGRVVAGETVTAFGGEVSSWARVNDSDRVTEVGVTLPMATVNGSVTRHEGGPAGAVITLDYPSEVTGQTFFNHFELHFNETGHPPAKFQVPHFDLHWYGVPVSEVEAVVPTDTGLPAANRFAAGYTMPTTLEQYQAGIIPQMGFHSLNLADLDSPDPFTATMVLGYYAGGLTFLEPMITVDHLQDEQSFTMTVPRPPVIGRNVLYPSRFVSTFDAAADAWHMAFEDFILVN
ncbi:MAG: hypothetical protein HUU35_08195 [Armatimonadetes bacterium]|nr:hypothetical protein [Armatimonadota bacterium]